MTGPKPGEELLEIPLKDLRQDGELNIRWTNDHADDIRELAESVKVAGIIEPLTVVKENGGKVYRLVFGFRRAAAARLAGLTTVPAIVRDLNPEEILEAQLIENLQRRDLLPIEEARAFKKVVDSGATQAELAKRIGKSQPYVANRIRLLGLPEAGLKLLEENKLTATAAKEILSLGEERAEKKVLEQAVIRAKENRGEPVGEDDLRYALQDAERRVLQRRQLDQGRANAKFPNCPVKECGKLASKIPWDASHQSAPDGKGFAVSKLGCSQGHEWSTATGKLETRERYGYSGDSRAKEQPKPTLPEVDPIISDAPPASRLAARIWEGLDVVDHVSLEWEGKYAVVTIQAHATKELTKLPTFTVQESTPKSCTVDARIDSWEQRDDAGRKEAAGRRARLEAWLATFGKPGRKPSKKEA